jgi:hypothetical protein
MRIKNKYFLSFFLPFLLLNNEAKPKKRDVTHTDQVIDRRRLVSLTPVFSCSCGAIRITKVENVFSFSFLNQFYIKKKIEGKTHMTNHVSLSWRKKHFLGRCWAIDSSCWMIWIDMYPMEWKRKRSLLFISPLFCIYCCTMGLPRAPVDRLQLISSSFCVYKYICDCCCRPCGNLSILLYT